ncbi:aryl-sulfate sulfotransferase [Maribacter sp. 1_2014MBL_MicDiv]|uniref:aryl-sulfate sulfotransferase n=1 Tax=Maribacter sp. 1_2014MBL_MicDiv TaxID=1644130 RepID=UPI0012EC5E18|nr:aryl-sulfate sulfotransferase [Maribacter sp. 1_2014MBL_MicDiv]
MKFKLGTVSLFLILLSIASCSDDSDDVSITEEDITDDSSDTTEASSTVDSDSYILAIAPDTGVYLIDHDGNTLFDWDFNGDQLGNDAMLQSDGSLVSTIKVDNPRISFGGYGGAFRKINADQSIEWEVKYSSNTYIAHHDINYLSNGNIIFPVWEEVSAADAAEMGFSGNFDIYPEAIIEMNPLTQEIVWEWHATDHLVQDYDESKSNFGVVGDVPNLIDVNYNNDQTDGDIMHVNGITLDETNDLLYMTVNFYSEVWVIDHSTTTEEAATSTGGNYNLGGDLVYRFGNPLAYDNVGEVTMNRVHYPNLFDDNKMLVFVNNKYDNQSAVAEYQLSPPYELVAGQDNEPELIWEFTDSDLYSNGLGSGVRMSNGNTLISEGTGAIWEVNSDGDVLWRYTNYTRPWRAYAFTKDDDAITALGL